MGMNSGEHGTFMGSVADGVRRTPRRSEPRFMDRRNFPGSFAQRSASSLRRPPFETNPEIARMMNLVSMLRTDPFLNIIHYLTKSVVYGAIVLALDSGFLRTAVAQTGPFLTPTFPNGSEGNSFSTVPFSGGPDSVRFQQIFDFQGLTIAGYSGPFLVSTILFREDGGRLAGFSSQFPDFQVNLSTTTRSADGLSSVFAENAGANDTVVVPRGAFHIGVNSGGGFTALIGFASNPFYYDPSQGNLLLDIRNFGGGGTSWGYPPFFGPAYVDAWNVVGDRISSVSANSVGAAAGITSSLGLVTQFVLTPVPEPSTVALLTVGLIAIGFSARSRQTRKG